MSVTENQHETSEFVVEPPTEFARMELAAGEWNSIYIPYLSNQLVLMNHYDVVHPFLPKYLRDFLEKVVRVGKVRRIDFVDRDVPSSTVPVKAAFVHFEYWYDTQTARNLREKLNTYGQYRQKGYIYKGKKCNFYQSMTTYQDGTIRPGYFDIRINHKPIEETDCDRNIHQLYAENLSLERELAERNARIEELQRELQQLRSSKTIGANTQMDYTTDDDAQVNAAEMDKPVYPVLSQSMREIVESEIDMLEGGGGSTPSYSEVHDDFNDPYSDFNAEWGEMEWPDRSIETDNKGPMTMAELSENDRPTDTKAPMSLAEWEGNRTIAQLS
jgi:hypothetical protein